MKFMENMKRKKQDNKGFSLVELIIVIAIMAILVGIVGTQVIPYLSKSRAAKDQQIISAMATAALTTYAENAEKLSSASPSFTFPAPSTDADGTIITNGIKELTGYADLAAVKAVCSSDYGKNMTAITFTFNAANHTLEVTTTPATGHDKYPIQKVTSTL